ncbi:MAG: DapH/DapD/GlmU-related protein, partial [Planctomycetota bacterium]
AARFAAKEAVLKALGTGQRHGIAWTDVEVVRTPTGKPTLHLTGEASRIAHTTGIADWSLSMSHVETHATASAVALGVPALPDEPAANGDDVSPYEQMLAGQSYRMGDPYKRRLMGHAVEWCRRFNATPAGSAAAEALLRGIFAGVGDRPEIMPPFQCDYGRHITVGDRFFANFGCVMLDCARITFGNDCMLGPNVQLYTPHHALDPALRADGVETSLPITIGDRVWIGGNAVVLPGVSIGSDTTIGAGSVVTKDVPAGVVAVGNPCRVIRETVGEDRRTTL